MREAKPGGGAKPLLSAASLLLLAYTAEARQSKKRTHSRLSTHGSTLLLQFRGLWVRL